MGCFDFFRFDNDFKFKNHKGDIVILEKDIEFQTKDLKSIMSRLNINENNEIVSTIYETVINEELPFEQIAEGQMKKNAGEASLSWLAWIMLKSEYSFSEASWKFLVRVNSIVGKIVKRLNVIRF